VEGRERVIPPPLRLAAGQRMGAVERVTSGGFAEVACRSRGEKKESGNAAVQMK
jgi:hypothetical protein